MKRLIYTTSLLLVAISSQAQVPCYVQYSYDDSGNRTTREWVCEEDELPDDPIPDSSGPVTESGAGVMMAQLEQDTVTTEHYTLIYPNPNEGLFWVEFDEVLPDTRIYILDQRGAIILQTETSERRSLIDIRGCSAGTYFVGVHDGQRISSHKVVLRK